MTPENVVFLLASVMVGEAEVLGEAAMLTVGHVIMNRVASDDFPNTVVEVIQQYRQWNGRGYPRRYHKGLARRVLRRPRDSTGGMLFCYSEQDRGRLELPEGDIVIGDGIFQLHLYREWPGAPEWKRMWQGWGLMPRTP